MAASYDSSTTLVLRTSIILEGRLFEPLHRSSYRIRLSPLFATLCCIMHHDMELQRITLTTRVYVFHYGFDKGIFNLDRL